MNRVTVPVETTLALEALEAAPFELDLPVEQTIPIVLTSPHSGRVYPAEFLQRSPLELAILRRSEDFMVDEIFSAATTLGAPFLKARFPRAFVDPNREPFELDPAMFDDVLPAYANTRSLRVASGLGTVAKLVSDGLEIYRSKLSFAEAERRIERLYLPYHQQLSQLIEATRAKFGFAILIDCHSMPSLCGPGDRHENRPDIVLGDRFGTACASTITRTVDRILSDRGFTIARNNPYAGGYTTDHYGRPAKRIHALQIELNRALYMDEAALAVKPAMEALRTHMTAFIEALVLDLPNLFRFVSAKAAE